MEILLSIIIPVYNVREFIGKCLDSILECSIERMEVLCVYEDNVTGSVDILSEYQRIDSRVKLIKQTEKGRVNKAREIGFLNSRGKYVAFVDGDDFINSKEYEEIIKFVENNEADVTIFNWSVYERGGKSKEYYPIRNYKYIDNDETAYQLLLSTISGDCNPLKRGRREHPIYNKIYRRNYMTDIMDETLFPDLDNYEDAYTMMQIFSNSHKIAIVPFMGYYLRRNNRKSSSYWYRKQMPRRSDIDYYYDFGIRKNFDEKYDRVVCSMILTIFWVYALDRHFFRKENPNKIQDQMKEINAYIRHNAYNGIFFPVEKALRGCNPSWIDSRYMRFLVKHKILNAYSLLIFVLIKRIQRNLFILHS